MLHIAKLLWVAQSYQKLPKDAKICQKLPKVAKSCRKLPKVTKSYQKLPKHMNRRGDRWAAWAAVAAKNVTIPENKDDYKYGDNPTNDDNLKDKDDLRDEENLKKIEMIF